MNYDILSYADPRSGHEIILCKHKYSEEQIKLVIPQDDFANTAIHKTDYAGSFSSIFQQGHFIMSHSIQIYDPTETIDIHNKMHLKIRTPEIIKEIQKYQTYWNKQFPELIESEPRIKPFLNTHFKELEYSAKDLKEAESMIFLTTPEHERTLKYINNLINSGINPMLKPVLIEELKELKKHLHHKPLKHKLIDKLNIWGTLKILKNN